MKPGVGVLIAAALGMAVQAPSTNAVQCTVSTVHGVNFGNYTVLDPMPNSTGIGRIRVACNGGGKATFAVSLSTGQSLTYAMRVMNSGANRLNYNLYTATTRSIVWGDGHGSTGTVSVPKNATTTVDIFGQIPAGQDVAVGTYGDSINATVAF